MNERVPMRRSRRISSAIRIKFAFAITACLTSTLSAAEFKLAGIFMDHAVLQRGIDVPVWGWADPGSTVSVSFAGQKHSAAADASGKWSVKLNPLKASAIGRRLTASSDGSTLAIEDVVVGEVWHASGQSNMDGHTATRNYLDHPRGHKAINAADTSVIRYCNIAMLPSGVPQEDLNQELMPTGRTKARPWTCVNTKTVGGCSAIAYFFAKELYRELNIPIGIIATPKGGAMIELFVPAETYKKFPGFQEKRLQKIAGKIKLEGYDATTVYNSRIHPIVGYGIAGMIWYQGESNAGRSDANTYGNKLSLMVEDLRRVWGQGDFPFYYVQLCSHHEEPAGNDPGWPIVQDQMRQVLNQLPNVGMAITNDINGHHPTNKLDGGERLAAWALADAFGKGIPYCGPLYREHSIAGDKVTVHFDHSGSRLMLCTKEGLNDPIEVPTESSRLFELAGKDGSWHLAKARLVDGTVELTSESVPEPIHVRYAFRESLQAAPRVYNRDGFPMSPFTSKLLDTDLAEQETYLAKERERKRSRQTSAKQ